MDMAYIAEYGKRGALLDLEKYGADTSKFVEGSVDSGKIDGKLVGINAGINSPDHPGQPEDLRAGQGGDARRHHLDLGPAEGGGRRADRQGRQRDRRDGRCSSTTPCSVPTCGRTGRSCSPRTGSGSRPPTSCPGSTWFSPTRTPRRSRRPLSVTEEASQAVGPERVGHRKGGHADVLVQSGGGGQQGVRRGDEGPALPERLPARPPSGRPGTRRRCCGPRQPGRSPRRPSVAMINWWVNSPECANINLAERGIPANTEILAAIAPKLSQDAGERGEVHRRHQARTRRLPRSRRRQAVARSTTPWCAIRPTCCSAARAPLTPRRSSWTRPRRI